MYSPLTDLAAMITVRISPVNGHSLSEVYCGAYRKQIESLPLKHQVDFLNGGAK